jgi:uncharacterized protein (TIGR03067 family)
MRTILAVAVVVLAGGLWAWADDDKKPAANQKGSLEGTWTVVSAERDGKAMEEAKDSTLTFSGKMLTIKGSMGEQKGTFTTDATKSPMTIDIKPEEGEQMVQGIYQVEKDELKLCFARRGAERPKEFSGKMPEMVLVVAKREKK